MNNQKKKSKATSFLIQGSILAVAGILVRIIGMVYRIPLTNTIGEKGMGVYSTAFSIYNILLMISSYSLPLAVSRLVAARLSVDQYRNARRVFLGAIGFATISGIAGCAITFFGADFFAGTLMGMPEAAFAIKTLAPTILIMAFLGVFRGYFQGHGTMIPTAISQVAEQVINAVISVLAGWLLFRMGTAKDVGGSEFFGPSYGAAGGTIGTGAGALTALLFCILVFLLFRRVERMQCRRDRNREQETYSHVAKVLVLTIVPVLVSTTVYQISTLVDQAIYAAYLDADYTAVWGVYSSKYNLLVHVPVAIASSLASSIIPALSGAVAKKNRTEVVYKTGTAIRFNMVIAFPATVGLTVLATPIMNLLFSGDNQVAAQMMMVGSTAVLFYSLSTITNSILQGIGSIWIPVKNALISLALHLILLAVLLWGFKLDIYGVVYANIFFALCMCILNNLSIKRILHYRQEMLKTFAAPLFSSVVMGVFTYLSYRLVYQLAGHNWLAVLAAVVVAVAVYVVLLLLTKGLDEVDLMSMPKGRTMIAVFKKLHLLR